MRLGSAASVLHARMEIDLCTCVHEAIVLCMYCRYTHTHTQNYDYGIGQGPHLESHGKNEFSREWI